MARIQQTLEQICDLGLGEAERDPGNDTIKAVRKNARESLSPKALEWLRRHRVSIALFGSVDIGDVEQPRAQNIDEVDAAVQEGAGTKTDSSRDGRQKNNHAKKRETLQARKEMPSTILFNDFIDGGTMDVKSFRCFLSLKSLGLP